MAGPNPAPTATGASRMWSMACCPACGGAVVIETDSDGLVISVLPEAMGEWDVAHLPPEIARDWKEAVSVYRVGAVASAVVMCGRTLEAAGDLLGVEGKTLQARIKKMLEDGLITTSFRDAMNYVRLIRNTGAHAGAEVSQESAEGTMRFTQQTLRLLFEVPGELNRLQGQPPELAGEGDGVEPD